MRSIQILFLFLVSLTFQAQEYFPKNDGVTQSFKNHVAVTNATVYVSASQTIEKATLLFKDDKILEIGTDVTIPKSATIIDATGKTIYPSFIDMYSEFGIEKPQATLRTSGKFTPKYDSIRECYFWNVHIKPE